MEGIAQHLEEPRRPAAGANNEWYERRGSGPVIVFVHGVLSDSYGCWYRPGENGHPGVYWPDLLARDPEFRRYSIYLGGYYTKFEANQYGVADCASELFGALERRDENNKSVLDSGALIFVCHSTGGMVVRYMLTDHTEPFADKAVGLVLMASPSYGSAWASAPLMSLIASIYDHAVARELSWASPILRDLDDRFRTLLDEERIPRLYGAEACENHFIFRRKYLPPLPRVVTRESAGRYFGRTTRLRDTDHFTSVKPDSRSHPAYTFLRDFRVRFEKKFLEASQTVGIPNVRHAPAGNYVCRKLQWDADIDEEGDACNELSYTDVVLLEKQPENWIELPASEVTSGQLEPYDLVQGDRTSHGITLSPSPEGARVMRLRVRFANRPTARRPASFCLRNYDLNAFSMDMEDLKTKPNFREDGIDYAEKSIDESIDFFSLTVRIPAKMKLAGPLSFEVYERENGTLRLHDGLTSALQPYFHYSSLLRMATLQIPRPAAPYVYRISWQLGAPDVIPGDSGHLVRFRARAFAERMLEARHYFVDRSGGERAQKLAEVVGAVLTAYADYLKDFIGEKVGRTPDAGAVSVSLMVLDSGGKRLVIVAGNLEDLNFSLDFGDGNAGRAWKRRAARVFDRKVVDHKHNVYFPNAARPPHEILFSLPLLDPDSKTTVHCVVNVGTYDGLQAELLRGMTDQSSLAALTGKTQEYVLQRLFAALEL